MEGHNLGSGAILIMNEKVSVVDFLKCCMKFFIHESCGRCSVCRIGTKQLYESFSRLEKKEAYFDELKNIEELAEGLKLTAFCPLGQSITSPVLSALKYFRAELEEGIDPKKVHKPVTREMNDKMLNFS